MKRLADSIHQHGDGCRFCLDLLGSCPAAFCSLSWDTRAPGFPTGTGSFRLEINEDWEQGFAGTRRQSLVFDNGVISGSTASEAGEAEISNHDWLVVSSSVGLKHTFYANSEDGEKRR